MNHPLVNIHTHLRPSEPSDVPYILNVYPRDFHPVEGELYSVGIHPWMASEAFGEDWEALGKALVHPQAMYLGECGLDKRCAVPLDIQQEVFERQIRLSESLGKPVIVHCVKAANEVLQLRRKHRCRQLWIIHGFRGNAAVARMFLQAGCALSFGPRFQEEAVRAVPDDRLYIETDEAEITIHEVEQRIRAVRESRSR